MPLFNVFIAQLLERIFIYIIKKKKFIQSNKYCTFIVRCFHVPGVYVLRKSRMAGTDISQKRVRT